MTDDPTRDHTHLELFGHFLASYNAHVDNANKAHEHDPDSEAIIAAFAAAETNMAIANGLHDIADAIRSGNVPEYRVGDLSSPAPDDFHSAPADPGREGQAKKDPTDNVIPLRPVQDTDERRAERQFWADPDAYDPDVDGPRGPEDDA